MSWLYSRALVEEYLGDISLDGEQSVQSNGNNTQQAYCAPDKMTDFSRLSQFGMTFKPLTEDLGEALLKSYREVFLARTYQQRDEVLVSLENDQECGDTWHGLLARYDQNTHSWKTAQCSLFEDLELSLETFPKWGMTVDGELYLLPILVQTTEEKEFGLSEKLPTPTASDYKNQPTSKNWKEKGSINYKLSNPEIQAKWPTPTATMMPSEGSILQYRKLVDEGIISKEEAEKMLMASLNPPRMKHWIPKNGLTQVTSETKNGGQLNPTWVEWLMGWPLGWTDLKPLEMDKSHCVQQQHGNCLHKETND